MLDIKRILNTKNSRTSFMKGLIYIAKADGKIDESEKQFFTNAMVALELSKEDINSLQEILNNKDNFINVTDLKFDSKKQKLFFFREVIQLCYIDQSYSEREKTLIENIRVKVGISKEDILKIEGWVKEGIEWSQRGEKLLEAEG
jgi:uncharacterized tellurite resistance protein B-like protein